MRAQAVMRTAALTLGVAGIAAAAQGSPVHQEPQTSVRAAASSAVDAAMLVCAGGSPARQSTIALASAPSDLDPMLRSVQAGGVRQQVGARMPAPLALERGGSLTTQAADGPVALVATGALAPGLSASEFTTQGAGLAARTCTASAKEAWIPVGDEQPGRLLTLVLVNSGSHAASVDVDVRSADGDVSGAAVVDKAVPAHGRVELNVAAEALRHGAPVVHVRSEGGAVQASVRDASDTGVTKGLELTAQYAPASTVQSVPDVAVSGGHARVRMVAPDGAAAVVRVQAWGVGEGVSHDTVVTLPAGRSKDVELTGLQGDLAAVRATSDHAVVVSGLGASVSQKAADFAWSPSAPDVADAAGATLRGAGRDGLLAVMSDGHDRTVTVVTASSGSTSKRTLAVPANGVATLPVAKDASVWLTASTHDGVAGVEAAVLLRDPDSGAVSSLPLVVAPWRRTPVSVVQG